jgi:hypothetical protein
MTRWRDVKAPVPNETDVSLMEISHHVLRFIHDKHERI